MASRNPTNRVPLPQKFRYCCVKDNCSTKTTNRTDMQKHYKASHGINLQDIIRTECTHCQRVFPTKARYLEHHRRRHTVQRGEAEAEAAAAAAAAAVRHRVAVLRRSCPNGMHSQPLNRAVPNRPQPAVVHNAPEPVVEVIEISSDDEEEEEQKIPPARHQSIPSFSGGSLSLRVVANNAERNGQLVVRENQAPVSLNPGRSYDQEQQQNFRANHHRDVPHPSQAVIPNPFYHRQASAFPVSALHGNFPNNYPYLPDNNHNHNMFRPFSHPPMAHSNNVHPAAVRNYRVDRGTNQQEPIMHCHPSGNSTVFNNITVNYNGAGQQPPAP